MINYFGYGANSTPEMMEAIIGRIPEGKPAILSSYELCIQTWNEISEKVRKILQTGWSSDFKTYCIRPKKGKEVVGTLWKITDDEREIVSKWEFWYEKIDVVIKVGKDNIDAQTEMIDDQNIKEVVGGKNYNPFPVPKQEILAHAKKS